MKLLLPLLMPMIRRDIAKQHQNFTALCESRAHVLQLHETQPPQASSAGRISSMMTDDACDGSGMQQRHNTGPSVALTALLATRETVCNLLDIETTFRNRHD